MLCYDILVAFSLQGEIPHELPQFHSCVPHLCLQGEKN